MSTTPCWLLQFDRIMKEQTDLYRTAARSMGLSECALWILYTLRQLGGLTQSGLCDMMYEPKQTVHSALKKLEREGYIALKPGADRRSKLVDLTPAGAALAEQTADRVRAAECAALARLTDGEQAEILRLLRIYTDALKDSLASL